MVLRHVPIRCLLPAALVAFLGCSGQAPEQTSSSDPLDDGPVAAAVEDPAVDTASLDEAEPADETDAADTPPVPPAPVDPPADEAEGNANQPAEVSNKILLGSPELTAGIPGEGPLTVDEIRAWLDRPENHEPLEVELPLGLAAGADQIVGLDENPMTRAKIELGRQLYFDPRLSADFTVSCASCHHPDEGYTRHTQFGVGIEDQEGGRNSPVSYNRILSAAQFWDGRAASLEEQAIGPIANPIEMGNTHEACVECLEGIEGYRLQFAAIFKDEGGLTIENVGKAIATFERAIVTGPSPFDYYAQLEPFLRFDEEDLADLKEDDPELYARYESVKQAAEANPMSESAIRGRDLFFSDRVGCTACHVGPNLTD
jgi:cytochrome c peroxidase